MVDDTSLVARIPQKAKIYVFELNFFSLLDLLRQTIQLPKIALIPDFSPPTVYVQGSLSMKKGRLNPHNKTDNLARIEHGRGTFLCIFWKAPPQWFFKVRKYYYIQSCMRKQKENTHIRRKLLFWNFRSFT